MKIRYVLAIMLSLSIVACAADDKNNIYDIYDKIPEDEIGPVTEYKTYLLNLDKREIFNADMDALSDFIQKQYRKSLSVSSPSKGIPRNSFADGQIRYVPVHDWCSGYYGGILWYIYELTGKTEWKEAAMQYTGVLEKIKDYTETHDVGIIISASYGNGYRLTGNPYYYSVMQQAAKSLCKRFNPEIGAILSWGSLHNVSQMKYHNIIIDNMINLELLMTCGSEDAERIAVSHADKTLQTHFRPDGSCYHVQEIDKSTGEIRKDQKQTQGYSYESVWARGQGWAMYGFSNMYRFTGKKEYLEAAVKCADNFIRELPEDLVPWWDFKDPAIPHTYRDASSAGIAACALLRMSGQIQDAGKALAYYNIAVGLMNRLTEGYLADQPGYRCLILHSVGHYPSGKEIDVNINYADYYYLEALLHLTR